MVATPTQIPELIDALYSVAVDALAATVSVVDGPPLAWDPLSVPNLPDAVSDEVFLFIGAQPDDDQSAAAQQEPTTMLTGSSEDIAVVCTFYASSGDLALKPLRDTAKGGVLTLKQAMNADQTLGGAVAKARVASVDRLDQRQTNTGADVKLVFTVAGRAFLR